MSETNGALVMKYGHFSVVAVKRFSRTRNGTSPFIGISVHLTIVPW
jgi:hypothetical protein